ncbi:hypothetical protein CVD28_11105 [Bacillus sp. M6-12]|uniref:phosphotransferase n=1 Tax=Bacillus sp. M6-12 TaxID=2054166 RepID=UPI000C75A6C3|nr:phosphotransferase [Bacillus sp. M6-12]PLS17540.1 hypothetical protein CVD28_11105 [Bacillus sp. M6-12]
MREKYTIEDSKLAALLSHAYEIAVQKIDFIPLGTTAYSYKVHCVNGEIYYLKLFDTTNRKQKKAVKRLDLSLAVTWNLYHKEIFQNLTYPIKTKDGLYKLTNGHVVLVLFNFIEGTTLNEIASKENIEKTANMVAALHRATPKINKKELKEETFDIKTQKHLMEKLLVLESTAAFADPYRTRLQSLILSNKDKILDYLNLLNNLRTSAVKSCQDKVICHGDLWGGNIVVSGDELFLLDWEYALFAPPEFDLSYFLNEDFVKFFKHYENHFGKKVLLDGDLLRFYAYRRKFHYLNYLLSNILNRNTDKSHQEHDLAEAVNCLKDMDSLGSDINEIRSRLSENIK